MAYRARDNLFSHILDEDQVDELIMMWKKGATIKSLAEYFGVHENTITNIVSRYIRRNR